MYTLNIFYSLSLNQTENMWKGKCLEYKTMHNNIVLWRRRQQIKRKRKKIKQMWIIYILFSLHTLIKNLLLTQHLICVFVKKSVGFFLDKGTYSTCNIFLKLCHRERDLGSHHLSFIVGGPVWCYILGESLSVYG